MPGTNLKLSGISAASLPIPGDEPWHVTEKDPAISLMTDFRWHSSVTVLENDTIDAALDHMKHTGVRCAFVVDGRMSSVVGMLTAYDITGEKPVQIMRATSTPRSGILVKDIMSRISDWRVLQLAEVERAKVSDVLNLFRDSNVTHIPVVEATADKQFHVRGLLSFAKVKRLLAV